MTESESLYFWNYNSSFLPIMSVGSQELIRKGSESRPTREDSKDSEEGIDKKREGRASLMEFLYLQSLLMTWC